MTTVSMLSDTLWTIQYGTEWYGINYTVYLCEHPKANAIIKSIVRLSWNAEV